jgi:hypothetical protein
MMFNKLIGILANMGRVLLDNRIFYQELIASIMIVVVGMCHDHPKNGTTLKKYLKEIIANIFREPGLLEGLYYLCKNDIIVE